MRGWAIPLIAALLVASQTGCFTTKITTRPDDPPPAPTAQAGQWFTAFGLIDLSDPAGAECPGGYSYAESEMTVIDWLPSFALGLAGGIVGAAVCDKDAAVTCSSAFSTVGGGLIGRRTVRYTCAGSTPAAPASGSLQ